MGKFKLAIYLFCMMAFAGCSGQKQTATGQKDGEILKMRTSKREDKY